MISLLIKDFWRNSFAGRLASGVFDSTSVGFVDAAGKSIKICNNIIFCGFAINKCLNIGFLSLPPTHPRS